MKSYVIFTFGALLINCLPVALSAGPPFAPYYDTFLNGRTNLTEIFARTGQKSFHLAFVLGINCVPLWGARYPLDEPSVIEEIRALQAEGAKMIVATGGALGPYLEHSCSSVADLTAAYRNILDTVGTNHLDIDVETSIDLNLMNPALAQLQIERPETTVSFTLMVQSDDYGLTPGLGVDLLKHAKESGVNVHIVNAMLMEFWSTDDHWGNAVVNASRMVLEQMKEIWPEKSESEIKKMYGGTPLIGRNYNGRVFEQSHATQLVNWANDNQIGLLAFWSAERDNGKCPDGTISPYCSGTTQTEFEYTEIFQGFHG